MKVVLLHKDVHMPAWVGGIVRRILTQYRGYELSKHVKDHAVLDGDRCHNYTLDGLKSALDAAIGNCYDAFEVEATQYEDGGRWKITKVCIRIPYDAKNDACLSLRPYKDPITKRRDFSRALVVTAWLNENSDNHFTLDCSKYLSESECAKEGL